MTYNKKNTAVFPDLEVRHTPVCEFVDYDDDEKREICIKEYITCGSSGFHDILSVICKVKNNKIEIEDMFFESKKNIMEKLEARS